jgi:hypothetical protein
MAIVSEAENNQFCLLDIVEEVFNNYLNALFPFLQVMALLSGFAGVYTEVCDSILLIFSSFVFLFFWKIHLIRNINDFFRNVIYSFILNNPGYHQEKSFKKYQCTEFLAVYIWDALQFGCNLCPGLRCCHEQVSADFLTCRTFM